MLPEVKKILYASDVNQGSRPVFRAAMSLCGHYHSEITYLHVLESQSSATDNVMKSIMQDKEMQALYNKGLKNLREKLHERIERFFEQELEQADGVSAANITPRIEEGQAWKVILDTAEDIDADLIVMGTRTHSALGNFFMGSTAGKVMQKSTRPVLVVPLFKED